MNSDTLAIIGFLITFILGVVNLYFVFKRGKSQNTLDNINSEKAAFALYEEYSKEVIKLREEVKEVPELKKKVEHLEAVLNGNLHLIFDVPLQSVLKDGNVQVTAMVKHVRV